MTPILSDVGDPVDSISLLSWLTEAYLGWRWILYLVIWGFFFYYSCRWVFRVQWRRKMPAILLVSLIGFALFRGVVWGFERLISLSYPTVPEKKLDGGRFQQKIDAMRALVRDAGRPRGQINKLHRQGKAFDPMAYFDVLPHISVRPGYVLDYIHTDSRNGSPRFYAREKGRAPYQTVEEYVAALQAHPRGSDGEGYLRDWAAAVLVDGTEDGFLEYAALILIGPQFYLRSHANYNDRTIVASGWALDEILRMNKENSFVQLPLDCMREALKLDLRPRIQVGEKVVKVTLVTFTKWGGFEEITFDISREYPHTIFNNHKKTLIRYDCGVCF